ncbi:MAG: DNA/pantothenate metabolism flavoprotein domain protein [Verrucomicrobia bacterium]|nr:DNA/pantothenate metabolism flavoprotein domain protein [Verrucomicrobiota bacterium]
MHCIVSAGPTYQPVDDVRRLTNFSTGKLGTELAAYLASQSHRVTLLRGYYSIFRERPNCSQVIEFTTPEDLLNRFASLSGDSVDAVYHAAAVGDFEFGKAWIRSPTGEMKEVPAKKLPSRQAGLLVELNPTPKIIKHLRALFSETRLVGWKYEIDGTRNSAIDQGKQQISENRTNACVVNGPAYGAGFGIVTDSGIYNHQPNSEALFRTLEENLRSMQRSI